MISRGGLWPKELSRQVNRTTTTLPIGTRASHTKDTLFGVRLSVATKRVINQKWVESRPMCIIGIQNNHVERQDIPAMVGGTSRTRYHFMSVHRLTLLQSQLSLTLPPCRVYRTAGDALDLMPSSFLCGPSMPSFEMHSLRTSM